MFAQTEQNIHGCDAHLRVQARAKGLVLTRYLRAYLQIISVITYFVCSKSP
jgi:hypothetical protein